MNNHDLFGSDDEEEENIVDNASKTISDNPNQQKIDINALFDDSDDNDDNDDIRKTVATTNNTNINDDDDFDDHNVVISSSGRKIVEDDDDFDDIDPNEERQKNHEEIEQKEESMTQSEDPFGIKLKQRIPIDIELPETNKIASNKFCCIAHVPKFLKFQENEFNPDVYDAKAEEATFGINSTSAVIRWKFVIDQDTNEIKLDDNDQRIRESNAKLLKWSDGSYDIVVGNAIFHGKLKDLEKSFMYSSYPGNSSFECIGTLSNRMVIQASAKSMAHASVAQKVLGKYKKANSILVQDVELNPENPEYLQLMHAKEEERRIRQDVKTNRSYQSGSGYNSSYSRRPGMNAAYLNDEGGDFDTTNLSQVKQRMHHRRQQMYEDEEEDDEMADFIVNDDDDYEEDEAGNVIPNKVAKKRFQDDDSDDIEDEDDSDNDSNQRGYDEDSNKKRFKKNVIDSDEDD